MERYSCCCEQGLSDGSSESRSSETEGDLLSSDMGARRKDAEDTVGSSWVSEAPKWRVISLCQQWEFFKLILKKIRDPLAKSRRHRRKEESAETRGHASAPPLTTCTEQKAEEEDGRNGGAELRPECIQRATLALHMCDNK